MSLCITEEIIQGPPDPPPILSMESLVGGTQPLPRFVNDVSLAARKRLGTPVMPRIAQILLEKLSDLANPGVSEEVALWACARSQRPEDLSIHGTWELHIPTGSDANEVLGVFKRQFVSQVFRAIERENAEGLLGELEYAASLDDNGQTEKVYDVIINAFDLLFRSGMFPLVDQVLSTLSVSSRSPDFIVAILGATWPAASKLPSRRVFLQRARERLRTVGKSPSELLAGLE